MRVTIETHPRAEFGINHGLLWHIGYETKVVLETRSDRLDAIRTYVLCIGGNKAAMC